MSGARHREGYAGEPGAGWAALDSWTPVTHALDALDAPSRRTVEAYMNRFLDREATGFGALFTEDGVFEGAFSGGALRGRATIEAHFRINVRAEWDPKGLLSWGNESP